MIVRYISFGVFLIVFAPMVKDTIIYSAQVSHISKNAMIKEYEYMKPTFDQIKRIENSDVIQKLTKLK